MMEAFGAPESRDHAVRSYHYLCTRAARRFLRPGLERADLLQIAAIGLIKAYDRYDRTLKTPFEAFAWLFIIGELMHYVRDHERLVRPPRRIRELERRCGAIYDRVVASLGREPTAAEMAASLGVDTRTVADIQLFRERAVAESLDGTARDIAGHDAIEGRSDYLVLQSALSALSNAERVVVLALYGSGYSQSEVANRTGYSRRHISRIHRGALKKMRPLCVSVKG